MPDLFPTLLTFCAMGSACAVLSVFVVLRRWAFIGEGIAHAGFGGAGVAWVLALVFPAAALFSREAGVFLVAMLFCFAVALAVAALTRRQRVHADTAIGIFLVGSLAWGFVASGIYAHYRDGQQPGTFANYLIGGAVAPGHALASLALSAAVLLACWLLRKEILAYCFDPLLADVSGVAVGRIHYLMVLLLAALIVLSIPIMGSVLVTALLILPGAIGLQLSRRLWTVVAASLASGVIACAAGPLITSQLTFIRSGPAVVLVLVLEFVAALLIRRLAPAPAPA